MIDKTTKTIIGVIGVLVLLLIIFGIVGSSGSDIPGNVVNTGGEKETIKIGVIIPLTGGGGFLGESARDAALLAQDQLDETKYNYELIFEDDKLEPKESANAANKLINVDGVEAIISFSSGTGNVVTPIAQNNEVVHIGIASDSNIAKGEYNFIHWTPPEEENRVFIEELERRDLKRLAILRLNQQGVQAMAEDLTERVKGTDIEIVADEMFNAGETDFKTMILKAQQTNPDIYILLAFSPEIEMLGKQVKEQGITKPLTAVEAFEFTEDPSLFEGMWYVQAADPTEEFYDAFLRKYGAEPVVGSPNVYDSVNLLVEAYEEAGKSSGEKPDNLEVVDVLSGVDGFYGALGRLSVGNNGIIHSKAVVRQIQEGKFVTIRG